MSVIIVPANNGRRFHAVLNTRKKVPLGASMFDVSVVRTSLSVDYAATMPFLGPTTSLPLAVCIIHCLQVCYWQQHLQYTQGWRSRSMPATLASLVSCCCAHYHGLFCRGGTLQRSSLCAEGLSHKDCGFPR